MAMKNEQTDPMSPETSPGNVSKNGVRRVNNRPIYILFSIVGVFLLIMVMVAYDRAAQQKAPEATESQEAAGNTALFADQITAGSTDGLIPPAIPTALTPSQNLNEPFPVVPDQKVVTIVRPDPEEPPSPPINTRNDVPFDDGFDEEAQRIRMSKLQLLEDAITARTSVDVTTSQAQSGFSQSSRTPQTRQEMLAEISRVRREIAASSGNDPTASYQAKLAQIQNMVNLGGTAASNVDNSGPMLLQTSANNGGYDQSDSNSDWKLGTTVQTPGSAYELRAGFVIPATLISGVNSDLPGKIMAQVSQDVSDTATGRYLLIPQGSRLIGSYSSDVAYGQKRVLVAWQRIVFPDGKALDIGSMPGADSAGYSGFNDKVNNHYFRIFGNAFLMSGITAGITLSQDNSSDNQQASDALVEALGQQLGQVAVEMIRKNMNIAPTLEIRPGYRFNVIVTKDMTFSKPYRSFDY